jgi:CRP-like cAMP-binding protein
VQRLLERFPAAAHFIAMELSRVVHDLLARVRDTPSASSGKYRLVSSLLKDVPAEQRKGRAVVVLPDSKRAIAAKLQITPEHFSRVLKELASHELISVEGSRVTIRDVAGLRQFARSMRDSDLRRVRTSGLDTRASPSTAQQDRRSRQDLQ